MKRFITKYTILAILFLAIAGATYWGICYLVGGNGDTDADSEEVDMTPAVIDNIKALGKWKLASIDLSVDVDTVISRWLGLQKNRLQRRYYGNMSVGMDMTKLDKIEKAGKKWFRRDKDTIFVDLPEVCLLDSNFIDESRTKVMMSDNTDFEQDATVKADMLARANERMLKDGIPHKTMVDIHRRVTSDIVTRFQKIGYKKVIVTFE